MNLTKKLWIALVFLLLFTAMTPTALAVSEDGSEDDTSFWEDVKGAGSGLWQSAKEHAPGWWQSIKDAGSNAVDTVKEHGPEWVEAGKEKGSELIGKGKDALQNAGDKVSDFLDDQQDQFWERTEQQIYGGSGSDSASDSGSGASSPPAGSATPDAASSAPGDAAADSSGSPGSSAPDESSAPPEQGAAPEGGQGPENSQGLMVVADESANNTEDTGASEPTDDADEKPQTAWEKFWDLSKRDAELRWQMTVEFWPLIILTVLAGLLIVWLLHRKR